MPIVAVIVVIIVIIIIMSRREGYTGSRTKDVIEALSSTAKIQGKISDFRDFLGDRKFSPVTFIKLMDLQRNGTVNFDTVDRILNP